MDSLEEDDSQITKDGEVVDQSAAAEDIDLLLGHDQRISQGESASDLLLVVDHVTNEVCHEGGEPFDGGDLCVTDGVGEIPMSPVDPLSPSVNPLSPGLHDAVDSEIHEGIGQLGYTEEHLEQLLPDGDTKVYGGVGDGVPVPITLPLLGLLHRNSLIRMIPTSQEGLVHLSLDDVREVDEGGDGGEQEDEDTEAETKEDDCDDGEMAYVVTPTNDINWLLGDAGSLQQMVCVEGEGSQQTPLTVTRNYNGSHRQRNMSAVTAARQAGAGSTEVRVDGQKMFCCDFKDCDRLYSTNHHLKVHQRTHTGERPYLCPVDGCGRAFSTSYGLTSHVRVHTGEKPYKCKHDGCEKAFKTSGDLQKHIRIHTGEKPFQCPYGECGKSFTTSNICKVHMRTHSGERPYTCPVAGCGKTFSSATNHRNHIRIHSGEKPYVCEVEGCGKRFTEYSSLYKHNVVHTQVKPYECEYCGKNYRQTSTLAMHKRTAHERIEPAAGAPVTPMAVLGLQLVTDESPEWSGVKKTYQSLTASQLLAIVQSSDSADANKDSAQQVDSDSTADDSGLGGNTLTQTATVTIGNATGGQQVYIVTDKTQLALLQMLIQQQQQGGRSDVVGISRTADTGSRLMKVESLRDMLQSADCSADVLGALSDTDVGAM